MCRVGISANVFINALYPFLIVGVYSVGLGTQPHQTPNGPCIGYLPWVQQSLKLWLYLITVEIGRESIKISKFPKDENENTSSVILRDHTHKLSDSFEAHSYTAGASNLSAFSTRG